MRTTIFFLIIGLISMNLLAQGPNIIWNTQFGGEESETSNEIIKTSNGDFILVGRTDLNDYSDFAVVRIDNEGELIWEKSFGEGDDEVAYCVLESSDGFIYVGGHAESLEILGNGVQRNFWILKLDQDGNVIWEADFGSDESENMYDLIETSDGNLVAVGISNMNDVGIGDFPNLDVSYNYGGGDFWVVKIDQEGTLLWEENFGGTSWDKAVSIVEEASSGNLFVGGTSQSYNTDISDNNGITDIWLIELDENGSLLWEKSYGGTEREGLEEMLLTANGDLVFVGTSNSDDFDLEYNQGDYDAWIFRVDNNGEILWSKNFGGSGYDVFNAVVETTKGDLIMYGTSASAGGDIPGTVNEEEDIWIVKLTPTGELIWLYSLSEEHYQYGVDIISADAGEYVLASSVSHIVPDGFTGILYKDFRVTKIFDYDSKVCASAFLDLNGNNSFDENEPLLGNQLIGLEPNGGAFFNNQALNDVCFYINEAGNYSVNIEPNPLWETLQSNIPIEVSNANFDTTVYFPLTSIADFTIQEVDLTSSITRCNQNTNVWLTANNKGTTITDGYIQLITDPAMNLVSSTPPVDSTAGDTLFWFYEDLFPTYVHQILMQFQMPGVSLIGETFMMEAEIQTTEGVGDAKSLWSSELVCAYDPNDKLVSPSGYTDNNFTLFEDTLDYTIRFQNTGNDTAFDVRITDQLNEHLALSSYEFITSSHPVRSQLNQETRLLEFFFDDIYLPDSFVNEPASHGFVKFRIDSKNGIDEQTLITNTANIYFDYNPAIVTNTVSNTMVSTLPIAPTLGVSPFSLNFDTIPWNEAADHPLSLSVLNLGDLALEVYEMEIDNPAFSINTESLNLNGQSQEEVMIIFQPFGAGDYNGGLHIESNGGIFDIPLTGKATFATALPSLNSNQWNITPNPNNGYFTIFEKNNELYSYKIYNAQGQIILGQNDNVGPQNIHLKEAGLYFLILETDEGAWIEKVIIQ